jgi:DNA-3-methyladenine glycosylase II
MARGRREVLEATEALAARDPVLRRLVADIGPPDLRRGRRRRSHFAELTRAICYQQLAGAAARAIHARFEALLDGEPTPETVLSLSVDELRGAGLSGAKTASIRDLADKVLTGDVLLERAGRLPDEEVIRELTLVRGIGRWTAEMFLISQLGRLDVWPVDDLGVRKGYARLFGVEPVPTAKALAPLADAFRPFRTIVAWYCWRVTDTIVPQEPER